MKNSGIEIITIKLLESISNDMAIENEKVLISTIGRRDLGIGQLVNTTDGGDGRKNSKQSEETKRKISDSRKGKGIGWKHTDISKEVMSRKQSGENNGFWGKKHKETVKSEQSKRISGLKRKTTW